ncbi:unnamed protein product [Rhodiola kirilowii]
MKKQKTLLGSPHGKDNSAFNSSKNPPAGSAIIYLRCLSEITFRRSF